MRLGVRRIFCRNMSQFETHFSRSAGVIAGTELVDAVLYFVGNGCKWRDLPHDFPPHTTVANFYYAAIRSGLWERIRMALVERVRTDAGRNVGPSYAIIDLQSLKTISFAEERRIDGGKNKRTQTAHCSGHYRKSAGGGSSCCQYT